MPTRFRMSVLLPLATGIVLAGCDGSPPGGASVLKTLQPTIESLEPEPAGPGDEVVLRGSFHKPREDQGLFVSFNGIDSRQVVRVSDTELKVVVPEGASSGNVVVVIGETVGKGRFLKIRDKKQPD